MNEALHNNLHYALTSVAVSCFKNIHEISELCIFVSLSYSRLSVCWPKPVFFNSSIRNRLLSTLPTGTTVLKLVTAKELIASCNECPQTDHSAYNDTHKHPANPRALTCCKNLRIACKQDNPSTCPPPAGYASIAPAVVKQSREFYDCRDDDEDGVGASEELANEACRHCEGGNESARAATVMGVLEAEGVKM